MKSRFDVIWRWNSEPDDIWGIEILDVRAVYFGPVGFAVYCGNVLDSLDNEFIKSLFVE